MSVIKTKDLHKRYNKKVVAINSISLDIQKGQIYSIVGPNGAGKSTLIRMLIGSLSPTSGEVRILDKNPRQEKIFLRKRIGYMPQNTALYPDLTAIETLKFFGGLQEVKNINKRIDEILEFTDLSQRRDSLVGTFSGGMKKKLSLACALLHEPEILFLDEPTSAIDPLLRESIWSKFKQLAKEGVTIILTTHSMGEAVKSDRLAILRSGSLVLESDPEDIFSKGEVSLHIERGNKSEDISFDNSQELVSKLKELGIDKNIDKLKFKEESLEDIIIKIIKENK
jgi:ABC-2 type transport system ATP-binding protein